MKKIFSVLLIMFVLLLFSGCNDKDKKLECTKKTEVTPGIQLYQDYNISFKKDKIQKIEMILNFDLDEANANMTQTFLDSIKKQYESEYGEYDAVTITSDKILETSFSITLLFDYNNLANSDKETLGLTGSEKYSDNKKVLEENGYLCNQKD